MGTCGGQFDMDGDFFEGGGGCAEDAQALNAR